MSTSRTGQAAVSESPLKLVSWKSIANYFDCDERTAKRWECERGLPVHRMPGERRSGVFAYSSELDSWLQTGMKVRNLSSEAVAEELEAEEGNVQSVAVEARGGMGGQPRLRPEQARMYGRGLRLITGSLQEVIFTRVNRSSSLSAKRNQS